MNSKEPSMQEKDRAWILEKRHDLGNDHWTTPDLRLNKGGVLSALGSAMLLRELGMDPRDPVLQGVADLLFQCQRPDGRFCLAPGAIHPCHTIHALQVLAALGHGEDPRLQKTLDHLLDIQHDDGGWRCRKFSYGRGPETEASNPGPTLMALSAFRHLTALVEHPASDRAVAFLLGHWETRLPLGPCHFGMGTLFMQVEYPFMTYNLFHYVHVLSFYGKARRDPRFLEALEALEGKLQEGQVVVERSNPKLHGLSSFAKGVPCALATARWEEIQRNLAT